MRFSNSIRRAARRGPLVLFSVVTLAFPAFSVSAASRPTPDEFLTWIIDRVPRDAERPRRHRLEEWPSDVTALVRIERETMPVLSTPTVSAPELTVLANAHRGEILALLGQTEIVEITNPVGGEPNGSGLWYQVRLPDGQDGWLFARPRGHETGFAALVVSFFLYARAPGEIATSRSLPPCPILRRLGSTTCRPGEEKATLRFEEPGQTHDEVDDFNRGYRDGLNTSPLDIGAHIVASPFLSAAYLAGYEKGGADRAAGKA